MKRFKTFSPNLGKPTGVHVRRSAARAAAGPSQAFLAVVLHYAGWCLSAVSLCDSWHRHSFRVSDFGVRSGCVTLEAGQHAGHSQTAEDSEWAGPDTRSWSRPWPLGRMAFWASGPAGPPVPEAQAHHYETFHNSLSSCHNNLFHNDSVPFENGNLSFDNG